ncbi:MAG TPA: DUF47 family protein [Methanomicrobiales archaeon]|nr:DUF47 family protein [Methanomicrobiales archaeon]
MGIVEWLVPQDKIFFDLFEELGTTCTQAAELLVAITDDYTDLKNQAHRMEGLEHRGDEISHRIYEQLNRTFITPLEPEEINRLTMALDDILDYIEGTTLMMMNYGITDTDAAMKELAQLIFLSVNEIALATKAIRKIKEPSYIEEKCIEVNRLENLADDVTAHAITELFKGADAVTIIKMKDIYQNLESATDKCEDAANVLSDIAIRHS